MIVCGGTGKVVESGAAYYCLAFVRVTDPKFKEYPSRVQTTHEPHMVGMSDVCWANQLGIAVLHLQRFPNVEKLHDLSLTCFQ